MGQRRNYYHAGHKNDQCDRCHKDYEFCSCNEYREDYHQNHDCCDRCHKDYKFCSCKEEYQEEGALVEKVICSKDVQKTAEFLLPAAIGPNPLLDLVLGLLAGLVNVRVTPDFSNIQTEVTVIKDQVINLGYIPARLDIEGELVLGGVPIVSIPIQIFFQEHTHCPGVCPGDQVIETRPVVDAVLNQPLLANVGGETVLNLLLFKAVIRTHITVVRQGIQRCGKICDLDSRRCDTSGLPQTINSPLSGTPNTTQLTAPGGGGGGAV